MHTRSLGTDYSQGWKGLWLVTLMPFALSASPLAAVTEIASSTMRRRQTFPAA